MLGPRFIPKSVFYTKSIMLSSRFIPSPCFIPSPYFVVRSPQSMFYTDRLEKRLVTIISKKAAHIMKKAANIMK